MTFQLALRNGNKYVEPEDPQPDLETGKELKMRKLFAEVKINVVQQFQA